MTVLETVISALNKLFRSLLYSYCNCTSLLLVFIGYYDGVEWHQHILSIENRIKFYCKRKIC